MSDYKLHKTMCVDVNEDIIKNKTMTHADIFKYVMDLDNKGKDNILKLAEEIKKMDR